MNKEQIEEAMEALDSLEVQADFPTRDQRGEVTSAIECTVLNLALNGHLDTVRMNKLNVSACGIANHVSREIFKMLEI